MTGWANRSSEMAFEHHERRDLRDFGQIRDRRPDALDGTYVPTFRFDNQVDGPCDRMDRYHAGNSPAAVQVARDFSIALSGTREELEGRIEVHDGAGGARTGALH